MGAHGAARPKCLLTLAGRPLLDWHRLALARAGVRDVAIVVGYRAAQLRGADLVLFHNEAWAETNMVASLQAADAWLRRGACIVSYGDIVYHPSIVEALADTGDDIVITYDVLWRALWSQRFAHPEYDAETLRVADGALLEIGARVRCLDEVDGQYMGLLRLTPAGWERIVALLRGLPSDEVRGMDVTTLLQRLLDTGAFVRAVPVRGRWCEVDTPRDLALYARVIRDGERWDHDWRE
jgi:choline kinase